MADKQSLQEWFGELCAKKRPVWDARMAELMPNKIDPVQYEKYAKVFVANAKQDYDQVNDEINKMMVRTATILTGAALVFAATSLKPSNATFALFLAITLCFAALAFVATLVPMAPSFRKAWFEPYAPTDEWTLLVCDDYTQWVMYNDLCRTRKKVITRYKRFHAIAARVLVVAALVLATGAAINMIG